jgi:hypothetical protein
MTSSVKAGSLMRSFMRAMQRALEEGAWQIIREALSPSKPYREDTPYLCISEQQSGSEQI